MSHVIFSCQNNQELVDLSLIASKMKSEIGVIPILYNLHALTGYELDDDIVSKFEKQYDGINFFNKKFYELNPLYKIILSVVNALNMLRVIKREKVKLSIIGVPLLTFRILSLLSFGRIKQVSYIRGVIVKSGKNTSLSSKINYYFCFLSKCDFFNKLISDYYSNLVVCIGGATADFIKSRGVPEANICVIGSVYCDSINEKRILQHKGKEIVYISSAFSLHGYSDTQYQQQELVIGIQSFIERKYGDQIKFKVRVHPRESIDDYAKFIGRGGIVDTSENLKFDSYQKDNTLFLSTVSTLLFEVAYLGYKVEFISNEHFNSIFNDWYAALNVNPISNWESLIEHFVDSCNDNACASKKYDNVITDLNKGKVIDSIIKEISSRFGC